MRNTDTVHIKAVSKSGGVQYCSWKATVLHGLAPNSIKHTWTR